MISCAEAWRICWRRSRPIVVVGLGVLALVGLTSSPVAAQSGIAGVVKDSSGAILPGVTVEASSPVLIEKTRSVVTDGQGAYSIVDLRPGVYVVTFSLTGFVVVKRDGIELPASFIATVNAEMRVGGVQETLTVTGQAPLVDAHQAAHQQTIGQAAMDTLPVLTRDPTAYTATIPGVTGVVLGGLGFTQKTTAIHGGNGAESFIGIDGFTTQDSAAVGGGGTTYYMNQAYVQEVAITTDAGDAEQRMSGISSNVIPKEGGNRYTGFLYLGGTNESFVANNVTDALKAKGFSQAGLKKNWDFTPAAGGPILKDKLWFYSSFRMSGVEQYLPNLYVNSTPRGWAYTPDLTKPAWVEQTDGNAGLRLTWQANPKNKFSAFTDWQPHTSYNRNNSSLTSLEATTYTPTEPNTFSSAVWKSPVNNRLLLEAGAGMFLTDVTPRPDLTGTMGGGRNEEPFPQDLVTVAKTEAATGINFGAPQPAQGWGSTIYEQWNMRASMSYVTGSHAFKVGMTDLFGYQYDERVYNGDYSVTLLNGRPNSLTELAAPNNRSSNIKADLGAYVKDDWTMKRLTLNLGLRYDYFNAYTPAWQLPAGNFFAARSFDRIDGVQDTKDISPRIGASYDLFGDGKTAVKGSIGRYVVGYGLNQVVGFNPVSTSLLSATRQWNDANGNFLPDCVLTNPLTNGECGQINNLLFGTSNPAATTTDPALVHGWGVRDFYWTSNLRVDHQLRSGASLSVGYYRSSLDIHQATVNLLTTPADYDPYCLTAPLNAGLPGGGGYPICGLYDVKPALFGKTQNYNTLASKYGNPTQVFNGVDVTTNIRLKGGGMITGGMSDGRTETNNCFVINSPQALLFCDVKPPFQPNIRFTGSYPIPGGIMFGLVYSNLPGVPITATYSASNAQIAPSLGRNVAAGGTALTSVPLIQPGTLFADRQQQLDLRLGKRFRVRTTRLEAFIDVNNVLNQATIQTLNTTYGTTGTTWLNPTQIQNPRYVKFSMTMDF